MTSEARAEVAGLMASWLVGGEIVVSDGSTTARAPAEVTANGPTVVLTAVFDEQTANFQWARREVRTADGMLVDAVVADYGSKAVGAVWTLEVPLEVAE